MNRDLLKRSLYDWRTFAVSIVIFLAVYFLVIAFSTPIGGCSGCLPDGNGGVVCVNECIYPNPAIWALVSYALGYVFIYNFKNGYKNKS